MQKLSQKEAVFTAVKSVCGDRETYTPSKEERAQIGAILFESFRSGKIELTREYTDSELKEYISGLQSNWLRKDKRLNGGVQYVAKNPGSRAGSGDASLKAMRALMSTVTSESDKAEIQAHIDARVAELNASKVKKVVINTDALPEALKGFVK